MTAFATALEEVLTLRSDNSTLRKLLLEALERWPGGAEKGCDCHSCDVYWRMAALASAEASKVPDDR